MLTGEAILTSMSIGVHGGKNDSQVAKLRVGSLITGNQTNIGSATPNHSGSIIDCASFKSLQAAPTARKRAPNMKTAATP